MPTRAEDIADLDAADKAVAEFDTEPKFDPEKVHDLLSIADLAREHPNLKPLFDEALRALAGIAGEVLAKIEEERASKGEAA